MSDPLFEFVGRYFWLLAIGTAAPNTFVVWRRASAEMAQKPELQEGYNRLISGYAGVHILPWLVMGLGIWVGGVPTLWYYFRPRDGNPWVLAWWGTLIGLQLLLFLWVFFQGGADFLAAHPSFQPRRSGLPIRLQVPLYLLGSALGMALAWFMDIPVGM
jgi:hypothetical protein